MSGSHYVDLAHYAGIHIGTAGPAWEAVRGISDFHLGNTKKFVDQVRHGGYTRYGMSRLYVTYDAIVRDFGLANGDLPVGLAKVAFSGGAESCGASPNGYNTLIQSGPFSPPR